MVHSSDKLRFYVHLVVAAADEWNGTSRGIEPQQYRIPNNAPNFESSSDQSLEQPLRFSWRLLEDHRWNGHNAHETSGPQGAAGRTRYLHCHEVCLAYWAAAGISAASASIRALCRTTSRRGRPNREEIIVSDPPYVAEWQSQERLRTP